MITVYIKKAIPKDVPVITLNDAFFNKHTAIMLDDRARAVIACIDRAEMLSRFTVKSKFDGTALNIDRISTGCKTALNILYHPDAVFDIRECGDNAVDYIYTMEAGRICCDHPLISFDMTSVNVCDEQGQRVITDYDALKEWWQHED